VVNNKAVKVELLDTVPRAEVAPDGLLRWTLTVPAEDSAQVTLRFQIDYPADHIPEDILALERQIQ
jgi:hypothetical protein